MNRIAFSVLIISVLCFELYGQSAKLHKTEKKEKCIIMGVDINCPIETAMQRFERNGFVIADNDKHILKGQYLNRKVIVNLIFILYFYVIIDNKHVIILIISCKFI